MPSDVIITINGTKQTEVEGDLLEVVVDTNLYLPAMFTIDVQDELDMQTGKLKYTDAATFEVGVEVKIAIETDDIPDVRGKVKSTLMVGEITAIEPIFAADNWQPVLRVRGYDRSHRLTRGTKTRTFGDANPQGSGVTEDQIVKTVAQEAGLSVQTDTSGLSGIKYFHVLQYNQTDLEFLWSRARLLGYQVYVEEKKLYFQKANAIRGTETPASLMWGENLASFAPRLTLMNQVDKAIVTGWDPGTKKALEGVSTTIEARTKPSIASGGFDKKGSAVAKEKLGGVAEDYIVDIPVLTVDQAKATAAAHFAEAESAFVQADGVCGVGDPRINAGRVVTIEGVGARFSGDYYVTEARHTYAHGDYSVSFSVTGRNPNTLSYLLNGDNGRDLGRIYGVVTAIVVNLDDPDKLGRVQVKYPWLPKYKGAELASNWARLAAPMAGKERGFFFTPEVDDEVLVAFEHGDPSFPYIVGTLWNKIDKPPAGTGEILASSKKQTDQRIIRSRSGHLIVLNDKQGEESIIIQSKSGHNITLNDKSGSEQVVLVDKTGKNKFTVDSAKNSLTIEIEGDVSVTAKGKTTFSSLGDITLDTKGKLTLKAVKDVAIEGLNIKAAAQVNAELGSNAQTSVKSSGITEIKGSLVKIN
jgi:phage protein D